MQTLAPSMPTVPQDQRHVLAERFKCKMCRNYVVNGACPYESRCMFAHGEHELRTMEMNLKDGLITEEAIKSYQRVIRARDREQHQQQGHHQYTVAPPSFYDTALTVDSVAPRFSHNPYSITRVYTYFYDDAKSEPSEDGISTNSFKADPSVMEP